jgi:hypothetical protein
MPTENEELRLTVSVDDQATAKLVGGEESSAEPVFEAIEAQRRSL